MLGPPLVLGTGIRGLRKVHSALERSARYALLMNRREEQRREASK